MSVVSALLLATFLVFCEVVPRADPDAGEAGQRPAASSQATAEMAAEPHPSSPADEVQLSYTYASLTKGLAPWRAVALDFIHKLGERKTIYAGFQQTSRFSLDDQQLMAGLYYPLAPHWTGMIEINGSPSYRVLPRWSLLGQVEHSFGKGWAGQLGIRHSEYRTATTNLAALTAEHNWSKYRAAYTFYVSRLQGGSWAASHRVEGNYYYGNESRVALGFSVGQELENIGGRGVLRTDTAAVYLTGRHWLAARWAVAYELGLHRQGSLYTRQEATLGLRYRF